jgi:hypothetical protein
MPADCPLNSLYLLYDIHCVLTDSGTERYDDMKEIKPLSFILPNGLAAVSAAFNNEKIIAVDGTTCDIFVFNLDGSLCDKKKPAPFSENTLRLQNLQVPRAVRQCQQPGFLTQLQS